jgi:peptide-methionine (S)-S-oxide reductase
VVSLPPFEEWAPAALRESHAPKLPEAFWREHGPTPHCVIKSPNAPIAFVL